MEKLEFREFVGIIKGYKELENFVNKKRRYI